MMKHIYIIITITVLSFLSCKEELPAPYKGINLIQFSSADSIEYFWSAALDPEADYDTLWVEVKTVGRLVNYDRELSLVQEKAIDYDLIYDKVGNIVDTNFYEIQNQAIVNKHYVEFSSPNLKRFMKIPANHYKADIPIVMHRDNKNTKTLTMQVRLVGLGNTIIGESKYSVRKIIIQ